MIYITTAPNQWSYFRSRQLGLYYLAQHAADSDFKVKIEDYNANQPVTEMTEKLLKEYSCHIIGFYVDHDNLFAVRRTVGQLCNNNPELKVIIGGPEVTGAPEQTMTRIPQAACGVIGEGEETFVKLLSLPSITEEHLSNCTGIIFPTENGSGEYCTTDSPKHINLERLSIPRYKELSVSGELPFTPSMLTGRGCTGQCTFCYEGRKGMNNRKLRMFSLEHCVKEFDYLVKEFKPENDDQLYISILDDTFIANPKRAKEFCRIIKEKYEGKVKWFCEARVDTLAKNPDLIPLMVEAGLARIQLGGESGSQKILDCYKKGATWGRNWCHILNGN